MTDRPRSCASAAWRCATACSCTARPTGPPRCATRAARSRSPPGRKPRLRAADGVPGRARRRAAGRGDRRHPAGQARRCRRPSCRSRTRACSASPPAPRSPARCCAGACAARPARRPPRCSRSRPRCSRCAAASWPPYHGVEHKAIAAYEQDADDAADAAKEHDRCGSHLVAPMLASNLAGALLAAPRARAARAAGRRRRRASRRPPRGRGVRLVRAQRRDAAGQARCAARASSIQRADRHARARRAPARGRPRRARGDPAGRNPAVRLGSRPQSGFRRARAYLPHADRRRSRA